MSSAKQIRRFMAFATAVLLAVECYIGICTHGWVRAYLGDVLVVILLYTIWRMISPEKPRHGWKIPVGILMFSFCVEFLQLWGFVDKFHIENALLRILIGTSFSPKDLLSYAVGTVPCFLMELIFRKRPL